MTNLTTLCYRDQDGKIHELNLWEGDREQMKRIAIITMLVNNAGTAYMGQFEKTEKDEVGT